MVQLCIIVDEPLVFSSPDNGSRDCFSVQGTIYKKRPIPDDELVFYDWIIDESQLVRGLEIHLPPDHSLLKSSFPLNGISQIEIDCFVRIWFGDKRIGNAQGKEAFGDIFFFATDSNRLAIVVGLNWLTPSQGDSLLADLHLHGR